MNTETRTIASALIGVAACILLAAGPSWAESSSSAAEIAETARLNREISDANAAKDARYAIVQKEYLQKKQLSDKTQEEYRTKVKENELEQTQYRRQKQHNDLLWQQYRDRLNQDS
jgi:hypothetical protein